MGNRGRARRRGGKREKAFNKENPKKKKQRLREIWKLQQMIQGGNSGDIKKTKRNSILLRIFLFLFVYGNVFDG